MNNTNMNNTNEEHCDNMIVETYNVIDYDETYYDPSCNSNVTIYDDFLDLIDKSIISGNISFIENGLKMYGNRLHSDTIKMASNIIIQILEEKMEDFILTSN